MQEIPARGKLTHAGTRCQAVARIANRTASQYTIALWL